MGEDGALLNEDGTVNLFSGITACTKVSCRNLGVIGRVVYGAQRLVENGTDKSASAEVGRAKSRSARV